MKEANAYLNFDGNCREAMQFYQKSLGAELQLVTFGEMPGNPPEVKDRIMHARLAKGTTLLMASDLMPGMPHQKGTNFSIAVHCDSVPEIEKYFNALGEDGKITMPLQATPWAQRFGMLTDRFGVNWMLNLDQAARG